MAFDRSKSPPPIESEREETVSPEVGRSCQMMVREALLVRWLLPPLPRAAGGGRQPRVGGFGLGAEGTMLGGSRRTGVPGGETELPDSIEDPRGVWGSGYVISPTSRHGSRIES